MWALSTRFYLVVVVFCSRLWNCRISVLDSETTWAWPGDRVKTTLLPSTANTCHNTRRVRQKANIFAAVWGRCTLYTVQCTVYSVQDILECCLHYTSYISKDNFEEKFWKNIHCGRVVVWCEPDDYPFFEACILPSVCSSIHPILQIVVVLNL